MSTDASLARATLVVPGTGPRWKLPAALFFAACIAAGAAQTPPTPDPLLNSKAPQFVLRDFHARNLDLARFRGKVVLLNFWATWCAPCRTEMPRFIAWQRQYGPQGLQIVGISMDDDPALARRFVAKLKLNYPVAMGDETLGTLYGGILGLPTTFLIDRNGVIRARFQGETGLETIQARLQELLAKP